MISTGLVTRLAQGLTALLLGFSASLSAEPTPVTVRVISQDAKFIGDHTGGAKVVLRDAETGAVLAAGHTQGGTGDTDLIMNAAGRSPRRASADTAAFTAVLDIDRPTLVRLEASGPLGRPGTVARTTSERWLIPGKAVTERDGWVVELQCLAVTPTFTMKDGAIEVSAKVEPLCGCPIGPGGPWPAEHYQVSASLWLGKRRIAESQLEFVAAPGNFAGQLAGGPTKATLVVFVRDTMTGATGLGKLTLKQ
jgi:hypothetical protein